MKTYEQGHEDGPRAELKPCPFCGGEKIEHQFDDGLCWERCTTCGATGPAFTKRSEDDAPDWNHRDLPITPQEQPASSAVDGLVKALEWIERNRGAHEQNIRYVAGAALAAYRSQQAPKETAPKLSKPAEDGKKAFSAARVCKECGMPADLSEYHPYAACLMFKACRDSEAVQANLDAVVAHGIWLSAEQPALAASASVPDGSVLVSAGALNMALNALRRDASEGKVIRGEIADELEAAAIASPASVPDGWQVVPKEPTMEMIDAWQCCNGTGDDCYRAMLQSAPTPPASKAEPDGDAKDAARYRFIRSKLCLTGNGDGTCEMHAINLPGRINGWPDPGGAVMEFCDAAIDAAMGAMNGEPK